MIRRFCDEPRGPLAVTRHVAEGGAGALELAAGRRRGRCDEPTAFEFLYALDLPLEQKIEAIATQVYGADGIDVTPRGRASAGGLRAARLRRPAVVIAKTHLSICSDPKLRGAPRGWRMPVREVRAAVGRRLRLRDLR